MEKQANHSSVSSEGPASSTQTVRGAADRVSGARAWASTLALSSRLQEAARKGPLVKVVRPSLASVRLAKRQAVLDRIPQCGPQAWRRVWILWT